MADNFLITALFLLFAIIIANGSLIILITGNIAMLSSGSSAIISPPLMVLFDEFNGSTTNFTAMNESGLKSIMNLTLEVTSFGKVVIDGITDITSDADIFNIIDFDTFAEFSQNMIEIDTGNLTSLGKSATVHIHNLSFSNPRILVDGSPCPTTTCQMLDYTNGTITFAVTQFSYYYSVDETPSEPPEKPSGPSSGPSGPEGPVSASNFTTDKDFIRVSLKQGETSLESVRIENNGQAMLRFNITIEDLEDYVAVSESSFTINPGQSKTLSLTFSTQEDEFSDIYTGKMVIWAGGMKKNVLLIMEIKEKRPLFDIYVNLESIPMEVLQGEVVEADIMLSNYGDLGHVDVTLYYSLRDFEGNNVLFKYDTIAVDEQLKLKRGIKIPNDTEPGFYLFYARLTYGNETAVSGSLIKVISKSEVVPQPDTTWSLIITAAIVLLAVVSAILSLYFIFFKKRVKAYIIDV